MNKSKANCNKMKRNFRKKKFKNSLKYEKSKKLRKLPSFYQSEKTTIEYDVEEDSGSYTIHRYEKVRKLKQSSNLDRNNNESGQDILRLKQLPRKQLENIFRNIDMWHYKRIREASRFFRESHDLYLVHTFCHAMHLAKQPNQNNETSVILMGLEVIMHYYLQAGFLTEIGGCLVSIFRDIEVEDSEETNGILRTRMLHLMQILDQRASQRNRQLAILLYTLTLVKVLMFLPIGDIICEKLDAKSWKFTFPQCGPFIVNMSPPVDDNWHQKNRYFLVTLLVDIAIASRISTPFRRAFDLEYIDMFGYGNDLQSEMSIRLEVKNSPFVINTIEHIVNGGEYEFQLPIPDLGKKAEISVHFSSTNATVGSAEQFLNITQIDQGRKRSKKE